LRQACKKFYNGPLKGVSPNSVRPVRRRANADQLIGAQGIAQGGESVGHRLSDLEHRSLQHRQPFRPEQA
jgi:hypothetical protein